MKYEPQAGDRIERHGHTVNLKTVTEATVVWELNGDERHTEPRHLFDVTLEKSLKVEDTTVHRNGVQIYPETTQVSGSHNTHARLAPSASKTWTNCTIAPAYVEANKHLVPEDMGSIYADEGTQAHDFAADILLGKTKLESIPLEMREPVGYYVAHCMSLVPEGVQHQVEAVVPLWYQPDQTGTCDFAVVTDERVTIRDYKHGMGVLVLSHENPQLAIYAYSLIVSLEDIYDFTDDTIIDMKVVQPRHHQGEDDEAWVLPLSQFRDYCNQIALKAEVATAAVAAVLSELTPRDTDPYSPDEVLAVVPEGAVFLPQDGDHGSCRWCKAKAFCGIRHADTTVDHDTSSLLALMPDMTKGADLDERIDAVLETEVVSDGIIPQHGDTLRLDYLIQVWRNKKKIEKFLGDVDDYLEALARERPVPGLKWVEGRQGNRAWANEEAADTFLRGQKLKQEERYNFKLKTPTQIEGMLKVKLENARTKNRFDKLVTRSEGKPVLVPEEDKRLALPSPADVMPDLTADEDI